jgi:hypothetical protein
MRRGCLRRFLIEDACRVLLRFGKRFKQFGRAAQLHVRIGYHLGQHRDAGVAWGCAHALSAS